MLYTYPNIKIKKSFSISFFCSLQPVTFFISNFDHFNSYYNSLNQRSLYSIFVQKSNHKIPIIFNRKKMLYGINCYNNCCYFPIKHSAKTVKRLYTWVSLRQHQKLSFYFPSFLVSYASNFVSSLNFFNLILLYSNGISSHLKMTIFLISYQNL